MEKPGSILHWGFYFLYREGSGKRYKIMRDFLEYYSDSGKKGVFEPESGVCLIGGVLVKNGKERKVFEPCELKSIEWVGKDEGYSGNFYGSLAIEGNNIFLAKTEAGNFFVSDLNISNMMMEMFNDLSKHSRLNDTRWHYLPDEYHFCTKYL